MTGMTGTILNALAILIGGVLGLVVKRQLTVPAQTAIKGLLGVLVIFIGLKTTWDNLGGGSALLVLKQITIVVLALTLGRLTGRVLRLQKSLNRLGQYARKKFSDATSAIQSPRWSDGFITCSLLFCVGPMATLGAIQDGLIGRWQVLGAKALMDGLATMAFVGTFGWGAICSAIPVVAYQGTISLVARFIAPQLHDPTLMMSINATAGLLVFCVAMIILELKKFEVADYLPSLAFAPLITWLWR